MRIEIETPLGILTVGESMDTQFPGIWIELKRPSSIANAPLALVEYTNDEADIEKGSIITRVWGDVVCDDYDVRVVHKNIEKYFADNME